MIKCRFLCEHIHRSTSLGKKEEVYVSLLQKDDTWDERNLKGAKDQNLVRLELNSEIEKLLGDKPFTVGKYYTLSVEEVAS